MSFGDNSMVFQRLGHLDLGGIKIEAGCWTAAAGAALNIPTTMTQVYCVVCMTLGINDAPCVSSGAIKGTLTDSALNKIVNYIAVGF